MDLWARNDGCKEEREMGGSERGGSGRSGTRRGGASQRGWWIVDFECFDQNTINSVID